METVGVVLAGGLSSRMKLDKSNLLWEDKTLVEHTKKMLLDAGCQTVLISDNKHQDNIADRFVNSGPLAGIEACLYHLLKQKNTPDQNMLLMPVDMPLMTTKLLSTLISKAETGSAVFFSLGRFPLLLPIEQQLLDWLSNALKSKSQNNSTKGKANSIKQMLSHLPCKIINIDDGQSSAFSNCNTPQEWQTLQNNLKRNR